MSSVYIGIDNGLAGGLVALSNTTGYPIISKLPMPTQAKAKGNEVDARSVWEWFRALHTPLQDLTVIIEQPGGSKNYGAAVSMADSFGCLRTLLEVHDIRRFRITPQKWQKDILPNCKAGDTKPFALSVVRRMWPDENWLETPRCKKPSEGLVDGALIAYYGAIKKL